MKKVILILVGLLFVVSCDETESVLFDPINGQLAYGFEVEAQSVTVVEEGVTTTLEVISTIRTNEDRTIPLAVDESSTGSPDDYQIGTLVIPAGEHSGFVDIEFNNFANMVDCVTNTLVVNLDTDAPGANGARSVILNYVRDFECPDLFLNITFDDYPGETTWQVADPDGNVLFDGDGGTGDPISENICVCPGDYVFTIFDSFGDGICCNYGQGSYEMVLNGTVLFSGGEFGAESVHEFTIE